MVPNTLPTGLRTRSEFECGERQGYQGVLLSSMGSAYIYWEPGETDEIGAVITTQGRAAM